MEFSRQEYWSGLPCPPPGDLPNPGIESVSLLYHALAGGFFTTKVPLLLGIHYQIGIMSVLKSVHMSPKQPSVLTLGYTKSRTRLSGFTFTFHFHVSLSRIGEGNGNPLQYSCPENPRDGGAWWAAVSGVTQSPTRLKRLSSSIVPLGLPWRLRQ